jgi:hypothetical protein
MKKKELTKEMAEKAMELIGEQKGLTKEQIKEALTGGDVITNNIAKATGRMGTLISAIADEEVAEELMGRQLALVYELQQLLGHAPNDGATIEQFVEGGLMIYRFQRTVRREQAKATVNQQSTNNPYTKHK